MRLSGEALSAARGGRVVFEDVSFAVAAGELLAITGPNGAGKSTLLRLIAGLLQPAAGRIVLEPAGDDEIGTQIHYFGHHDGLKPALSLVENLDFWRLLWGGTREAVEEALFAVRLDHLASLPVAVLSAGQKRRVALARMLVAKRPIWLLDEPATALDAAAEANLGRLIAAHLEEGGIVIAATHRGLPVEPAASLVLGEAA